MVREGFENDDQLSILKEVESELQKQNEDPDNYPGYCAMIDGPGGNGKTFLLKTIVSYCNMPENNYLPIGFC